MEMGSNSLGASGDSLHGLTFGEKIYFEDGGVGGSSSNAPPAAAAAAAPPPPPAKKRKGAVQGGQQPPPRCQVEGCMVDLVGVKTYYFRHKVCVMHSKAPRVMVEGLEQRFCQQCSRFHRLLEFDQGKRSCRRRLAGHNERRRKPPPGPFASCYGRRASSFHEDPNRFRSFLMDFSHPRFSSATRDAWPRFSSTTRDVRPTNRPVDWVASNQYLGVLHPPPSAAAVHGGHPCMQGPSEGPLYSVPELPRGECHAGVSDSSCALSLLSTQIWNNNTTRNLVSSISASSSFAGTSVAQPAISNNCVANAWGFIGHGGRSSSQNTQHDIGLTRAAEVGDGQFSGELELALQGNWQYHGSGRAAYDQSGHVMHWSL